MRSNGISWRRAFVEGVVIVGSILLAFALDAWWDDRSRETELRKQFQVVAGEMEAARQALQTALTVHDWNAHLARHLRSELSRVPEGADVVVSDTLVGPLLSQTTADVTTGSLEAFIAAGGLDVIDDPDVRGLLLAWPTRIEDLQDDEIYLRNFAAADLDEYLRAHASVANAELLSYPVLVERFGAGPPVDPDLLGTLALRRQEQLLNLLAAREAGDRGVSRGLAEMVDQATRIIAAAEAVR